MNQNDFRITIAKKSLQEGDNSYKTGKLDEAIRSYEECLVIFQENLYNQEITETLNKLAMVYADKGEYDKSIGYYEKLLVNLKDMEGLSLSIALGNIASIYYYKKGEWDKAIQYYKKSIEIQERLEDIQGLLKNYTDIGSLLARKGEWDKALEYYKKQFKIAEGISNFDEMSRACNNIAILFKNKGLWINAKEYYEKSLEFLKTAKNEKGVAAVIGNLGNLAMEQGEWESAMYFLKRDLEISIRINDLIGIAHSKTNLGLLFSKMGMFEDANECYQSSLEIIEKFGDLENKARTLNNLGELQIKAGDWDCAKRNLEDALNISSNPLVTMSVLLNLGNLLKIEKKYHDAHLFFKRAFEIIEKTGANPRKIDLLNKLGELYLYWYKSSKKKKCLKLAKGHFEEAFNLSKEYTMPLSEATSLKNVGELQSEIGEFDKAIDSFNNSIKIFDKLGSKYESVCAVINLARILFRNGKNQEAEVMVKNCLFDSIRNNFKILQIEGHILLGDITQKLDYYLDALRIAKFNSKIYKRTCYLLVERIKGLDNEHKLKLSQRLKYINEDEYFEQFLSTLVSILRKEKYVISGGLPTSLKEELTLFESTK